MDARDRRKARERERAAGLERTMTEGDGGGGGLRSVEERYISGGARDRRREGDGGRRGSISLPTTPSRLHRAFVAARKKKMCMRSIPAVAREERLGAFRSRG